MLQLVSVSRVTLKTGIDILLYCRTIRSRESNQPETGIRRYVWKDIPVREVDFLCPRVANIAPLQVRGRLTYKEGIYKPFGAVI
ncbi:hypothetical protein ACFLZR_01415, partial [Candidatus Neomarinimicrobiota bacterium]